MESSTPAARANHLRVVITKAGQEIVSLELPARTAGFLANLVPEAAKRQIEQGGISLADLSERATVSGYAPQVLFSSQVGEKHYQVWLE